MHARVRQSPVNAQRVQQVPAQPVAANQAVVVKRFRWHSKNTPLCQTGTAGFFVEFNQ
jgi:hypothetical protein